MLPPIKPALSYVIALLISSSPLWAETPRVTNPAQAELAQAILALSNTFERDPRFSYDFAPDFSAVQQRPPNRAALVVENCTATAVFGGAPAFQLFPSTTGDASIEASTLMFDLSTSELVPAEDGALYAYGDGSFFDPDKPQADSAQTAFAFAILQFATPQGAIVQTRIPPSGTFGIQDIRDAPITHTDTRDVIDFTMDAAVSKARIEALVDAILTYQNTYCSNLS